MSLLRSNIIWRGPHIEESLKSPLRTFAYYKGNSIKNVVIGLHGFGDQGANFASLAQELSVVDNVLWLFPQGPQSCEMIADGFQWFPLFHCPEKEFLHSEKSVFSLLNHLNETLLLPFSKMFLFGFSQGGALALHCGLKHSQPLGGVMSLSGFLMHSFLPQKSVLDTNLNSVPFFFGHGVHDQVVFPVLYYDMLETLKNLGAKKYQAHIYDMAHTFCPQELFDFVKFIEDFR